MVIHPSAVVSPRARIAEDVQIGPFSVIEDDVEIGAGCVLENHVVVRRGTTLGNRNRVFDHAVLGGLPQHVHMPERPGRLIIGSDNTIREGVTIHRALGENDATRLGDGNLLMVNAHVAHDCRIGNRTIIVNNVMLAGHVTVEDRAYLSGAVAVHQFARIGALAMVGGQGHIGRDVPPYVTVDGLSSLVVGLNKIGLRRAGMSDEQIRELMAAYRMIYRSGLTWNELLARLAQAFPRGPAAHFHEFLSTTQRGIIPERRLPPGAVLKLRRDAEGEQPAAAPARQPAGVLRSAAARAAAR